MLTLINLITLCSQAVMKEYEAHILKETNSSWDHNK